MFGHLTKKQAYTVFVIISNLYQTKQSLGFEEEASVSSSEHLQFLHPSERLICGKGSNIEKLSIRNISDDLYLCIDGHPVGIKLTVASDGNEALKHFKDIRKVTRKHRVLDTALIDFFAIIHNRMKGKSLKSGEYYYEIALLHFSNPELFAVTE
jgi:hypothetical protein